MKATSAWDLARESIYLWAVGGWGGWVGDGEV